MEYHLRPLGKTCAGTGAELAPGSTCYSVLVERAGELERRDFSENGWKGAPEGTVAQWKCMVPRPVETKRNLLDPDALQNYFDQLTEEADPLKEKLRYILAILLLRKKRLRLEDSREEGESEVLQFVSMQGEGSYEVRDHQLTEEEMHELQASLMAHMAADYSPV